VEPEVEPLTPTIDLAMLADAVQAVQGKLNVLGGGWDTLYVSGFPARHPSMALALRLRVPWSMSGTTLELGVELQDADGNSMLPGGRLRHSVVVPARSGAMDRPDIGVVRSFTIANLTFQAPGDFSFVITVDGEVATRLRFAVRKRA
jgi:hypothetical protein